MKIIISKKSKTILSVILTVLILFSVFAYKFYWGRPLTPDQLYMRTFFKILKDDPETLSNLGMFDNSILDFYSDDLTDMSPEMQKKKYETIKKDLEILRSYDTSRMNHEEKLSYDIFQWYLDNEARGERFMFYNYPVNQYEGVQNTLPELMAGARINDTGSAEDYIKRLSKFWWKFDGLIESLKLRQKMKIIPPRFMVDKVITQIEDFCGEAPEENMLATSFKEKVERLESVSPEEKKQLVEKAVFQVKNNVYHAYQSLKNYLESLLPETDSKAGVWKFPDGEGFYEYKVKANTTTGLTPEQVHRIGLNEVERVTEQMSSVIEELGYKGISPGDFMRRLAGDGRFKFQGGAEGREAVLKAYREEIKENERELSGCFGLKPLGGIDIQPVSEFKEASSPQAYLTPAFSDGKRPAVLYINLGKINDILKFNIPSLAAHEGIPGHHLQRGIQRQNKELNLVRKALPFSAFAEGWAMYAERLAWENKGAKDPYENLGRLQSELWRAVRLVVDTGIHYKKWTREQAVSYMTDVTGMPENTVEIEVERYIADPGQALCYMTGMLKILELRERCDKEIGAAFDLREFHDTLLKNGVMPLNILENEMDRFIGERINKTGKISKLYNVD